MRDKEEMREYMQKRRFFEILERMKQQGTKCVHCDKLLETLHHKDEDHKNNRLDNLEPVCHEYHLEIPHASDIALETRFYASKQAEITVTRPKTIYTMLENVTNGRIYNVSIRKPNTYRKIHIIEGSRRLLELFISWGFTELV